MLYALLQIMWLFVIVQAASKAIHLMNVKVGVHFSLETIFLTRPDNKLSNSNLNLLYRNTT